MHAARGLFALLIGTGLGLGFVAGSRLGARQPPQPEAEPGVVFIVEGVGGFDLVGSSARKAWPRAGVRHEIRDFIWTHGWGQIFKDLQDTPHLLRKANELADEVRQVKAQDPDRSVYLVGKSGGAAIVLAAAEQLPPQTLERIILLSPAVSRAFDLSGALRATKGEIVSFYSRYDQLILGWGTRHFGTADRIHGPGAGLRGFILPSALSEADRASYQRLVQIPWNPSMFLEGHPGIHVGTSMPAFLAKEVAPWLKP